MFSAEDEVLKTLTAMIASNVNRFVLTEEEKYKVKDSGERGWSKKEIIYVT